MSTAKAGRAAFDQAYNADGGPEKGGIGPWPCGCGPAAEPTEHRFDPWRRRERVQK